VIKDEERRISTTDWHEGRIVLIRGSGMRVGLHRGLLGLLMRTSTMKAEGLRFGFCFSMLMPG
jgi:hypothetical protein